MSTVETFASLEIDVRPIGGRIGAEVRGISLSGDLSQAQVQGIRQALLRHKVLFFRAQHHLDDAMQEEFARLLGEPVPHPTIPPLNGTDYILDLDGSHGGGRASSWHTDITFAREYPKISILRGVVVPETGGDTVWANTAAAYATLPDVLRELADRLWAVHSNDYDYAEGRAQVRASDIQQFKEVFTKTVYETHHPLVRVHPATGERSLILGHFFKKFIGVGSTASRHLFEIFQSHIVSPENSIRWRWAAGDVAMWDNQATQHRAVDDYGDQPRIVRRVTLRGEAPVSVDGRSSVAISPAG
jgi:alpha-ketoglutarate-dependent taurine dioxygenase